MDLNEVKGFDFQNLYAKLRSAMLVAPIIKSGRWQSTDVGQHDAMDTPELTDVSFYGAIPETMEGAQRHYMPNLPWAEEHFQERVGGKPTNPGDTYMRWPWYKGGVENHKGEGRDGKFSHTYQERIWPKEAGEEYYPGNFGGGDIRNIRAWPHRGVRFRYGDLDDVVELLTREPLTRQAYLPIWFPEDTGVVHGERVPCSIGYQFLIRNNQLSVIYTIRSCDFVRYLRDDAYLATRLGQWMRDQLLDRDEFAQGLRTGTLTMHIGSLHCFRGDLPKLKREHEEHVSRVGQTN